MEKYKLFSFKAWAPDVHDGDSWEEAVSDKLNGKLNSWVSTMKAAHPKFRYRIVNADSFLDPRTKSSRGVDFPYVVVHVAYEI